MERSVGPVPEEQACCSPAGAIQARVEAAHLRSGCRLTAQVLKAAHHGSGSSSGAEFLATVAPRYAVISVGTDNRCGHPAPAVLDWLAASEETTGCAQMRRGKWICDRRQPIVNADRAVGRSTFRAGEGLGF